MSSKLSKRYKRHFAELREIINGWNIIPDCPEDEFDSVNHLFLSKLYQGMDAQHIEEIIHFELNNNYGLTVSRTETKRMTLEVLSWWKSIQ